MTREEAKELLPIIQAFVKGKAIQDKIEGLTDWYDTDEINLEYNGEKIIHRITFLAQTDAAFISLPRQERITSATDLISLLVSILKKSRKHYDKRRTGI